MDFPYEDIAGVLASFNPWWQNEKMSSLPQWKRAAFHHLLRETLTPSTPRAILVSGPRQVGKTTLALQTIESLLKEGVPAGDILYVTFDHPIIKLAGIENVLKTWREREPKQGKNEYLFLDEAQFLPDWSTWIKHQVDFVKDRRIVFTGSSIAIQDKNSESGVGRWRTIKVNTLSFYEHLQLRSDTARPPVINISKQVDYSNYLNEFKETTLEDKRILFSEETATLKLHDILSNLINKLASPPPLPELTDLNELFSWETTTFQKIAEKAQRYQGYFHQYLLRGGFPQLTTLDNITDIQKILREDIVDKVLKRDMTALFKVRNIPQLEQIFLYLCMHHGSLLDVTKVGETLGIPRATILNFIEIFQNCHLIYRLPPHGYGKQILRAKYKHYLADASIPPAVLLQGKSILDRLEKLGTLVESTVYKHLYSHYYEENQAVSYWQGKQKKFEVDFVVDTGEALIPYECKYRSQKNTGLAGLKAFCKEKNIEKGFLITKDIKHFGLEPNLAPYQIMQIPAPLFCYWTGQIENFRYNNETQ